MNIIPNILKYFRNSYIIYGLDLNTVAIQDQNLLLGHTVALKNLWIHPDPQYPDIFQLFAYSRRAGRDRIAI